ncbi:hypothetical protein [Pseudomonas carnis]|uniref:hypothetical protein n=1 Tax=Pseudomonas carnis TaxID=2487355 RepID=UPI001D9942AA|nr:hypothetical protein [Pseudomonas carnis]CAH0232183.1 hypothetical protein SRABI111_02694 [Pseudomonas carnis]CAH0255832.1 hypothetical protein SRABI110_03361 [Pseudomonas carnis]CAH0271580.1 hypothetical protein SRABI08_03636 [Pseudomonas carnis]CAH0310834.1 hypothetical protein SRABI64_04787 [Pseudomonas carnis]
MNQQLEVRNNETRINGAIIIDAGRFAGIGIGLPDELAVDTQEKADLIERRLSRIESALGLNAICAG